MNLKLAVALLSGLIVSLPASARDDKLHFPVKDALESANFKARLDGSVQFYFGDAKHPKAAKELGTFTANKKTNAFNKNDQEGCEWVLLGALISLQDRAKQEGGNAVVNIRSAYRGSDFTSSTEYECGAGTFVTGVALRGDVVKLP